MSLQKFRDDRFEDVKPLDLRDVAAILDDLDPGIGDTRGEFLGVNRRDQGVVFADQVKDLAATLEKAKAAGAKILSAPYAAGDRSSAIVQFPGGYIAEVHSLTAR